MTDILTLTLNPALDVATAIDHVEPLHKMRCGEPITHPGGGGINVARVLHRLGASVQAIYTAGGPMGLELTRALNAEGVPALVVPIQGQTRQSFSVYERAHSRDYRFVLPGPTLLTSEWQACQAAVVNGMAQARFVVVSGGLPQGVPEDFYASLAAQVRETGGQLVLDSNGSALAATLAAGVYMVKPSLRELRDLTGLALADEAAQRDAARAIVARGEAQVVALSLGEAGALLVTAEGAWRAPSIQVPVATTVGAGDSFVAGLVWGLSQDLPMPEAFAYAMASGAAALLSAGTNLAQASDIERLKNQAVIQAI